ncbi:MAG TPA: bifunctional precorrin-2 dehydrogenase/sirohydrochlorin ferrochelatase [Longimicrobium sp.]|nr:bifunctional precorrin-2 dehydrogenase/sirohydrochlorin ferrochelatase [Longimicrobium sp.]
MSARYPVMLDVSRLSVLVVGGGEVALRKVRGLVEAGALPEIVSPEVHPQLLEIIRAHGLTWHARPYLPGDGAEFSVLFAATDSRQVNEKAGREAADDGALVDIVDDPRHSNLHVPATIRHDDVVVAVSTGGASPLLARRLRERLEAVVTPGLGRAARRLAHVREEVRARWPEDGKRRREAWFGLVTPEFLDAAIEGRDEDVEHRISACLSQS